jgi:threonine/homoserine/homoserine lactone efflux protein
MLIFLITFIISFLGSIHPGPLNLSVIQITLRKNFSLGLLMALGGVIPEIIYGHLAVEGVMIFEKYPVIFQIMKWAVVPILLIMGYLELTKRKKNNNINDYAFEEISTKKWETISKGFFLSLFNPQLLPFWIVILVNYQNYEYLKISELSDKIWFVLGTSTGAFTLNYVYAHIASVKRDQIFRTLNQNRFEQLIGWTFVGMGILQIAKLA